MIRRNVRILFVTLFAMFIAVPALADDYEKALQGVKSFDAVYDFTHGDPKVANVILTAVDLADEGEEGESMPNEPNTVIVFHDAAVNLLTSDRGEHTDAEWAEVQKFQQSLREMKKEGVTMEVCAYALDVFGVDRDTVIPEIVQVPNGFVSVVGYQEQGYALVRIP